MRKSEKIMDRLDAMLNDAINGTFEVSGYDEGAYFTGFHGIDRFVLSKMTVVEGEKDPDVIWEKLQTRNYLIYATDVDDNNLVIEEERKHRAGDKITLQFKEGITKEYEMEGFLQYYTTSVEPLMSYES